MVHDTISIRVGYNETDGQGRVHHAQYLNYFERGRVELMRSLGHSYREFEAGGLMLVVAEMNIKYQGAAAFDDLLSLKTTVVRSRGVRIEHHYEITRLDASEESNELIVTANSMIACVDREGKVRRLPDYMRRA
jgi:acyl-CoA thioester hydrolase